MFVSDKKICIYFWCNYALCPLPSFSAPFLLNTVLGPALGIKVNPQAAAEAEKLLFSSLSKIESFWLEGNGKFLLGSSQPSVADLSLVCEIMQLEVKDWLSTHLLLF